MALATPQITISVCTGPAVGLVERQIMLAQASTVRDACIQLVASGLLASDYASAHAGDAQICGIWGQLAAPETVLKHGDRLEFYQPLIADPKATRRRRALESPPTNAPEGRSIYARGNKKRRVGVKQKD